jgi:hypothetical protein
MRLCVALLVGLCLFFEDAHAIPGGCGFIPKGWRPGKTRDPSRVVFADYGISTKPSFKHYLLQKITHELNRNTPTGMSYLPAIQGCSGNRVKKSRITHKKANYLLYR